MTDELFFEGSRYIPASDAAQLSNFTRDYIARLAREGKITGRQVARQWYVSEESIRTFVLTQEYANSTRRDELARERQKEYGRVQKAADPVDRKSAGNFASAAASGLAIPVAFDLHKRLKNAAMRGGAQVVSKATDVAISSSSQVPLYVVSPTFELLHKIAAAVLAISFVVGAYTAEGSLISSSPAFVPGTSVTPSEELAAAGGFLGGTFSQIANTLESGVDAFLAPLYGVHLATAALPQATVAVNVVPTYYKVATAQAPVKTVTQTIVQAPVIQRIVESQNVIASGGITQSELTQQLQILNNALTQKINTLTAANTTAIAQNYNVTAQSNAIDQLANTTITNPSISGGSIANATISNPTISGATFTGTTTLEALAVSDNATSTFGGGIDLAGGCFAVNGNCIGTAAAGNPGGSNTQVQFNDAGVFSGSPDFTFDKTTNTFAVLNSSSTNATSTNATTTNLYVSGSIGLGQALPVSSGGTGTSTAPGYGQLLVGNGSGGFNLVATSSLGITGSGGSSASSTLLSDNNTFSGTLTLNGGTTTASSGFNISSGCFAVNGVCVGTGGSGSSNVSTSSQNTWSALQIFAGGASTTNLSVFNNAYFGATATSSFNSTGQLTLANLSNSLLSVNASGQVVATSTIGNNQLQNSSITINGSNIALGGSATITAASSTLLANNNTFSGGNLFTASTTIGNGTQIGGLTIFGGATTTGTASVGALSIGSLSGLLKTVSGAVVTATAGVDYLAPSSLSAVFPLAYQSGTGAFTFNGLSTSSNAVVGNIPYFTSANTFGNVATSSLGIGSSLSVSGTLGSQIGGTDATISLNLSNPNTWSALQTFSNILATGSTTLQNFTAVNATTSQATTTNFAITNLANTLLAVNANGTVVATSTIGNNQLQNSSVTINGNPVSLGGSITVTAASSTLLANNNTWTGLQTFANASSTLTTLGTTWFNGLTNAVLSTNANGQVIATTSIGTNYLTGALGTINGTSLSAGGAITITAASSTLLANNNTFTGGNLFLASTTIGNGTQAGGLTIFGGATTTGNALVQGNFNVGGLTTLGNASTTVLSVSGNSYLGTGQASTFAINSILSCAGSEGLQTDGSGNISCGAIATGGASSGGGWTSNGGAVNGSITESTSTYLVAVGATSTPYAKFSVVSGSAATTTLALVPASSQTANVIDIYNTSGSLGSVFTAGGSFGIGTTSPSSTLSVNGSAYVTGTTTLAATTSITGPLSLGNLPNSVLGVNGSGQVVATTSIGTNYLTGALGTINGTPFSVGGSITVGSASTTLLSDNNTWTGLQTFANASSTLTTLGTTWFNGLNNAILSTNGSGQVVATTSIGVNYLTGTLSVGNGGTGSTTLGGILKGNGTGAVQTAVGGTDYEFPLTFSTGLNRTGNTITNTGVLSLGSGYATTTGTSIALSTTTQSFNGLTIAQTITSPNGSDLLFTPNVSGTLNNSGLTNSSLTVSAGSGLSGGGSVALGGSTSLSLNLGNANNWTGLQTFANASSSLFSVTGNAYFGGTATSSFNSAGQLTLANLANALLSTNGSGQVVATTSIGTNYLTGALATINSTSITAGGTFTITAASSTLLSDNNTFSGNDIFSNLLTMTNGLIASASSTIGNGTQTGGLTISGGATTTANAYFGGNIGVDIEPAAGIVLNVSTTSNVAARGASITNTYVGAGSVATQGINAFAFSQGTANNTVTTGGGGLRNRYVVGNETVGYNVAQMSAVSGFTEALGTFSSTTNATDFNAEVPSITAGNTITNFQGLWVHAAAVSGLTNQVGVDVENLTAATNNTELLLGTATIPSGNYGLYQADTGNNYFGGNVGIGSTTPGSLLSLGGIANFTTATSTFYSTGGINLTAGCFSINGTCVGAGTSGITALGNYSTTTGAAISLSTSTLSFNGLTLGQTIGVSANNLQFTSTVSGTLNNSGLTNSTIVVNGTTLTLGDTGDTITAASSTLLANNNTWTGLQTFANASSTLTTLGTTWFNGLNNAILSTNGNGQVVATTSIGVNYLTGVLPIANGGTNQSSQTTNGVNYFDGTEITSGNSLTFTGTNLGIGTTSPFALLSLSANNGSTNTTLFQISSSTLAGTATTSLLSFNNSGQLAIGPNISPVSGSTQLSVLAGTTTAVRISSNNLTGSTGNMYAQGQYVYIVEAGTTFDIWDISNPAVPVRVSHNTLNHDGDNIYVQGRYAYITDAGTTNSFEIWDVSNPAAPVRVSQSTLNQTGEGVYVQGRYAYLSDDGISATNAFEIWDVSNPAAPVRVSQSTLNNHGDNIFVEGRYAYLADQSTTNAFEIWDVSNPAAPVRVSQSTLNQNGGDISIQGRYAYITDLSTTNSFEIWDISNPASPARVSQSTLNHNGAGISVQGRYAYLSDNGGPTNAFEIWDVSNPAAPVRVSQSTLNQNGVAISVEGRYVYFADLSGTNAFEVWDLGGAYIQQLEAGGIEAGTLSLRNNLAAVDAAFSGGVNVGQSLNVTGSASVVSATSTVGTTANIFNVTTASSTGSLFNVLGNGNVGIGTTSPTNKLEVAGNTFLGGNLTATGTATVAGLATFNSGFLSNASSTFTTGLTSLNGGATTTALTVSGPTWFTGAGLASALLSTDANGKLVATTSIGTNLLTGALGTINGTTLNAGGSITITAASSTLLADNNTFSGNDIFSNLLTLNGGLVGYASSTIGNGNQNGGLTIFGGATTTGNAYFNGTVGVGTTSPWAQLSVFAGGDYASHAASTLFAIGSSTAGTATSTLLSFNNNGQLTIGPNIAPVSSSTQLSVLAGTTTVTRVGQANLANSGNTDIDSIYIQGRYAYVAEGKGSSTAFEIFDVSNPASPLRLSQSALSNGGSTNQADSIYVQGRYAYVAEGQGTTNAFEIFDISNPSAPVRVGQGNLANGSGSGDSIYVQGRYAYIAEGHGTTNAFEVFDISNPSAPVRVSQSALADSALGGTDSVSVQGRYAYIAEGGGTTNALEIFDVSNASVPVRISQSTLANGNSGDSVSVQGRYAYIAEGGGTTNAFEIFDVSNPASPSRVSQSNLSNQHVNDSISVEGRYAYVAESGGTTNAFEIFDISNPSAPVRVNQTSLAKGGINGGDSLFVSGRYAYVAEGNGTTNAFEIFDLGGAYIQQLEAGGIEAGTLSLRNNLAAVDAAFSGGVNVGQSLNVTGSASIVSATSTLNTTANIFNITTASSSQSIFNVLGNGEVGIGTSTPWAQLSVDTSNLAAGVPEFAVGSSTRSDLVITQAGNVGIGTTSPGSIFSVNGVLNLTSATSTFYSTGGINLTGGCFSVNGTCVGSNSGSVNSGLQGQFAFYNANGSTVSGTSTVFITQAGQVGIGTTSPGIIAGANQYLTIASNVADTQSALELSGNTNVGGAAVGRISFYNQVGTDEEARIASVISPLDTGLGSLAFYTGNDGVTSEVGRFDAFGDFGVGTTSPWARASIDTTNLQAGQPELVVGSSTRTDFVILQAGNIGIGTTSPFALLSLSANNGSINTTLFQISSSTLAGTATTSLLSFNNSGQLTIGPNITPVSSSTQLSVLAGTTTAQRISQSTLANGAINMAIQGRYAYVVELATTNGFEIWDISNPSSPVRMSQNTISQTGNDIYVAGRYAYITEGGTDNLEIWDVSNPSAPVRVSQTTIGGSGGSMGVYVQGRYAYITSGSSSLQIWDVSNPALPVQVSSKSLNTSGYAISVQGNYAYLADDNTSNGTNSFEIWNVSNPASPTRVSSSNLNNPGKSIYVQGRYAYLADQGTTNAFEVWDISNPASPTRVSSTNLSSLGQRIYVQGRYAYISHSTGALDAWDVSNPAAPTQVFSQNTSSTAFGLIAQGRYLYLADSTAANGFEIFDLGGAYIQQLEAGGIEAGTLSLRNNLAAVDAAFSGGVNVGQSLNVTGSASVVSATSTVGTTANIFNVTTASSTNSIFNVLGNGNVGIGTSSPYSMLSVAGQVVGQNFVATSTTAVSQFQQLLALSSTTLQNFTAANATTSQATTTNLAITSLANSLLAVNANGSVVATTSIGTNLLTGTLATINSTAITAGGTFTITAASSTLLANNNTWTGLQTFANASSTLTTLNTTWFNGLNNAILSTNGSGQVVATTSIGVNYLTGVLPIANGGTNASSQVANGLNFYNGTNITSSSTLIYTSGNLLGLGTTTPYAELSLFTGGDYLAHAASTLLSVGSSTAGNATSTLFTVLSSGNVGVGTSSPSATLAVNGSTLLTGGTLLQTITTTPVIVGTLTDSTHLGGSIGEDIQGRYAYVAGTNLGWFSVIDITNPASPVTVGTVQDLTKLSGAFYVRVEGRYAYVTANGGNRLTIVDISNPTAPTVVGSVNDATKLSGVRGLYVSGKYAYVTAQSSNRFTVIDVSNPAAPVIVSSIADATNLANADGVYVVDHYAYVTAGNNNEVTIIDVSNPTSPVIVGDVVDNTNLGNCHEIQVYGKYAYVACQSSNSLTVLDVSSSTAPTVVGEVIDSTNLGSPKGLSVDGRYAYVTSNTNNRLTVVDISTPAAPKVVSSLQDNTNLGTARDVSVVGRYAYVVANNKFNVVDVGGADLATANVGSLGAQQISSFGNASIGNDLDVRHGLNVGYGGIQSNGSLLVQGQTGDSPFSVLDSSGNQRLLLDTSGDFGIGTSTPGSIFSVNNILNLTAATSTFYSTGGINLTGGGCFAINGTCVGGSSGGITTLGNFASTTGTAISLSTSTVTTNGQTLGLTIVASANGILFTPTISGTLNNAGLTNSTISGVALGGTLNSHSHDATLNGTSYNGSASVSDWGINLSHANNWTGLQTFTNASSSLFSVTGTAYFGGTATSSFASNGALTLATQLTVPNGGTGAVSLTGLLQGNGTSAVTGITGTAGQFPYYNGSNTLLATSSIFLATNSNVGIGTTSPFALLSLSANNGLTNTTLFQISSSTLAGTATNSLLSFSNTGGLTIGSNSTQVSSSTQFSVLLGTSTVTRVSQSNLANAGFGNSSDGVALQGRYAYVVEGGGNANAFEIFDVSNPTAPVRVSQTSFPFPSDDNDGDSISVQGKYAYIITGGSNSDPTFFVYDISNPQQPVLTGSAVTGSFDWATVYVAGRYAYVAIGGNTIHGFEIFDISNPSNPSKVADVTLAEGANAGGQDGVYVQNGYAYIAEGGGGSNTNDFEIFNVSNPASPIRVSQSTLANYGDGGNGGDSIYIQGRYAYIAEGGALVQSNVGFEIWDISNPASPSRVSQTNLNKIGQTDGIFVQGRYAYIAEGGGTTNTFQIFDVSNPASPVQASQNNLAQGNASSGGGDGIVVQGRYAYIAEGSGTTNAFEIFDLGGSYIQQGEFGGLEAGTLSLRNNLTAADGQFSGGLTVGSSLTVNGSASILAATSTFGTTANIFNIATASSTSPIFDVFGNGNVGIGTTTPSATLALNGNFAFTGTGGATSYSYIGLPVFSTAGLNNGTDFFSVATSSSGNSVRAMLLTAAYTGNTAASTVQGLNASAAYTAGAGAGTNLTGVVRNRYIASNQSFGYSTANLLAVSAAATVQGTLASSTDNADFNAEQPIINSGNLMSNFRGLWVRAGAVTGTLTSQAGVDVENLTAATNNTELLLGTASIPTGNFGLYQSDTNNNYFAGNVGLGTTSPFMALSVNGSLIATNPTSYSAFGPTTLVDSPAAALTPTPGIDNMWIATTSTNVSNGIRALIVQEDYEGAGGNRVGGMQAGAVYGKNVTSNGAGTNAGGTVGARFFVVNDTVGHNVPMMSGFSAVAQVPGTFASTTNATDVNAEPVLVASGALVSNFYSLWARQATVSGSLTNWAGLAVENIGPDASNTTEVLLGTPTIPSGHFGVYQSDTNSNYFAGSVGIGTSSPSNTLTVTGTACFSQGAGTATILCGSTAGNIYYKNANAGNYDVAENYVDSDSATDTPGTVMGLNTVAGGETVTIATTSDNIIGVVSTAPGMTLGGADASTVGKIVVPIALSGRVPVKISFANGPINEGDRLTLSTTTSGVAVKALVSGETIGTALQTATGSPSRIDVFVQSQYYVVPNATSTPANLAQNFFSSASGRLQQDISGIESSVVHLFQDAIYATTGIFNKIYAQEVHTDELCVSDSSGETCITRSQLNQLLANAGTSQSGSGGSSSGSSSSGGGSSATSGAPVIEVSGNDPATVQVGAVYNDLGASITGPVGDTNLGISASVDGGATTTSDQIQIDTSQVGAHTIIYTATDQNGLTGTATRTVNVVAPQSSDTTGDASSTDSSSTGNSDASSTSPADNGSGDASSTSR